MINISSWNILGFAIGLAIVAIVVFVSDKIKEWSRRKEGRKCIARFEATKEQPEEQKEDFDKFWKILTTYRPKETPLDMLRKAVEDRNIPKGKISYETFFTDIEAMGFKEEPISMFETSITFEEGAYKYLKKYKARELFPDCLVVLYTNFHQPIPSYPKIHSASSSIRIDYIDNSAPFWARLFTGHTFAELESFNGSLKDLIIKLHGHYVEHCEGLNLNNNNTKEKK